MSEIRTGTPSEMREWVKLRRGSAEVEEAAYLDLVEARIEAAAKDDQTWHEDAPSRARHAALAIAPEEDTR